MWIARWSALARDLKIGIARVLGKLPQGPTAYPPIGVGAILAGSGGAGSYFPQPVAADGVRLDDVLGAGHWIVCRDSLTTQRLSPFGPAVARWMDEHVADAVLVRPDRYVFGTGDADRLVSSWELATGIR